VAPATHGPVRILDHLEHDHPLGIDGTVQAFDPLDLGGLQGAAKP
jgi:hypothetical protein